MHTTFQKLYKPLKQVILIILISAIRTLYKLNLLLKKVSEIYSGSKGIY